MSIKRIVVLTSGGDAPGMNAALRATVRTALYHGLEVFGAENGYSGLLHNKIKPITANTVANVIQRGGTILKTGRCHAFHDPEQRQQAISTLQGHGIDALVVLGGDGSFRGASLLSDEGGFAVVGIPCTIDNDIAGTEYTIGFDTACNTALDSIDKIRDTALSLDRNFIVEVMGRSSGFIAVAVGIAGGAEIILTPEFPLSMEALVEKLQAHERRKLTSIIVAAEADTPGRSFAIAREIARLSGIDYKVCNLGHTQRGGTPSAYDRKTASVMGFQAIKALLSGHNKTMVAVQKSQITLVPFSAVGEMTRYFSDQELLEMNEVICG